MDFWDRASEALSQPKGLSTESGTLLNLMFQRIGCVLRERQTCIHRRFESHNPVDADWAARCFNERTNLTRRERAREPKRLHDHRMLGRWVCGLSPALAKRYDPRASTLHVRPLRCLWSHLQIQVELTKQRSTAVGADWCATGTAVYSPADLLRWVSNA